MVSWVQRLGAALKAFQKASGLKETGELDVQTAEKLGVAKPKPPAKELKKKLKEKKEEKK